MSEIYQRPQAQDDEVAGEIIRNFVWLGRYLRMRPESPTGKAGILWRLGQNKEGMTQKELQDQIGIKPSSLSETLAKLEHEGAIVRSVCENDRRAAHIMLSDYGKEQLEALQTARKNFHTKAFTFLTEDEKTTLVDILKRIREQWENLDD